MRKQRFLSLPFVAAFVLCCGGSVDHATVDGSVGGESLRAADATSVLGSFSENDGTATRALATIVVTDQSGACELLSRTSRIPSAGFLILSVVAPEGAATVSPRTYAVGTAADAEFVAQDQDCTTKVLGYAASGSVTLSTVGAGGSSGTFELDFPGGDHLAGSFDASSCDADIGAFFAVEQGLGTCG